MIQHDDDLLAPESGCTSIDVHEARDAATSSKSETRSIAKREMLAGLAT
jgi:hypothetical protein